MLNDKVVIITGVTAGLGRTLVGAFAGAGAKVVGSARSAEAGGALAREVADAGGQFEFVAADIRLVADCQRLIDAAVDRHGRVDVLINNAGARTDPPLLAFGDVDEENWDTVVDTNLKGAFFCTRAAAEVMTRQDGGQIINISSMMAEEATKGMAPYCVSKAGLVHLTRVTAVEYLDEGITANAIILGSTATGQQDRTAAAQADYQAGGQSSDDSPDASQAVSLGLTGPPLYDSEDVARAIVWLCHDDAQVINGASITIDHGVTAGAWTSHYTHLLVAAGRQG